MHRHADTQPHLLLCTQANTWTSGNALPHRYALTATGSPWAKAESLCFKSYIKWRWIYCETMQMWKCVYAFIHKPTQHKHETTARIHCNQSPYCGTLLYLPILHMATWSWTECSDWLRVLFLRLPVISCWNMTSGPGSICMITESFILFPKPR